MTVSDRTNTNDMLLLHRTFRREFARMPDLLRRAGSDHRRAALVGSHALEMVGLLHVHHHGEDLHLYPLLRERAGLDRELLDRMEAQHLEVGDALEAIQADLATWADTADGPTGERIAERIERVLPVLDEHLAEEERHVLPLAARTVSQTEWDKMAEHGLGAIAPKRRLVILGHILADASPGELAEFTAVLPAPVRFLYRVVGRRQYHKEISAITG